MSHSHNPWGCDYWIRLNGVICQRGQTDTGWLVFGDFFFWAEEGQELVNLVSKCCCFLREGDICWCAILESAWMPATDWRMWQVFFKYIPKKKMVLRRWIIPNASMKIKKKKRTSVPRMFNSRINNRTSARKISLLVKAAQKMTLHLASASFASPVYLYHTALILPQSLIFLLLAYTWCL